MAKLHELLAAENDLGGHAKSLLVRTVKKFGDLSNYVGQQRNYKPIKDGGEPLANEDKLLPSRARVDLALALDAFGQWVDVSIQKEVTNQATSADVLIDDEVVFEDLPATALLNLENKLLELGKVLRAIPTNDLANKWEWDEDASCFMSSPRVTYRMEKTLKTLVQYEATKDHPAQVHTYTEDAPVGEWTTVIRSGSIPLSQKRELLARWQKLSLAVKVARQRANDIEASKINVSEKIVAYLWG